MVMKSGDASENAGWITLARGRGAGTLRMPRGNGDLPVILAGRRPPDAAQVNCKPRRNFVGA